jgi:hypothetical protein
MTDGGRSFSSGEHGLPGIWDSEIGKKTMSRNIAVLFMLMALALATTLAQAPAAPATTHTLMPVPKSVAFQAGRLPVQASLTVAISKHSDPRLLAGLDRTLRRIEPVKGYRRGNERPGGQLSPLTGLVDVARADSMAALKFRMAVDKMISDPPRFRDRREDIVSTLQTWRDIRPAIDRLIDGAPILREAAPLAVDLAAMGTMGIEAVSYLATGMAPPPGWREAALAQLDAAAKPRAALELAVVLPMRKLVVACAEVGQLSAMSRDAWKTRVDTLAAPPQPQKK